MASIIGWVIIPAIALYAPIHPAMIVNDMHQIGPAINHLEGTTWVNDEWGRVVLAAHSHGWFARLDELVPGDRVIVIAGDTVYEFEVSTVDIVQDNTALLAPSEVFTLTLLTCSERGVTWLAVDARKVN